MSTVTLGPPGRERKRVVITGVSGLLGRAAAAELCRERWSIVGVSRGPGDDRSFASFRRSLPGVRLHQGDLGDIAVARARCAGAHEILHLAGSSGVTASYSDPLTDLEGNARPFLNLLASCTPGTRVILVSTQLVYGDGTIGPLAETAPLQPESPYAAHRRLLEEYGRMFASRRQIDVTVLRLGNVFGDVQRVDRERSHGVVPRMLRDLTLDGRARLLGGGLQFLDLLHARDVARAVAAVLRRAPHPGSCEVYNLSGERLAVAEIAQLLIEGLGRGETEDVAWPPGMSSAMAKNITLDDSRFRQRFGWAPSLSVRDELVRLGSRWSNRAVAASA